MKRDRHQEPSKTLDSCERGAWSGRDSSVCSLRREIKLNLRTDCYICWVQTGNTIRMKSAIILTIRLLLICKKVSIYCQKCCQNLHTRSCSRTSIFSANDTSSSAVSPRWEGGSAWNNMRIWIWLQRQRNYYYTFGGKYITHFTSHAHIQVIKNMDHIFHKNIQIRSSLSIPLEM